MRDKPITREDLYVLVRKCQETGVSDAVMMAVAPSQPAVPIKEAQAWAAERGVALAVVTDWGTVVRQALHWAPIPEIEGAMMLPALVEQRLIELEVSAESIERWAALLPRAEEAETPQAA